MAYGCAPKRAATTPPTRPAEPDRAEERTAAPGARASVYLLSAQPDTDRSKGAGEAPASRLRARIWVGSFPPCSTDMIVRIDFDPSGGMLSRTVESQPRGCM